MKENIRKVYENINPRGADLTFAEEAIEKAQLKLHKKDRVVSVMPLAAAFAVMVIAGAAGIYMNMGGSSPLFVGGSDNGSVSPLPEAATTADLEASMNAARRKFEEAGFVNAYALKDLAVEPKFEVIENTFDGIDISVAALAADFEGSVFALFELTEKDGFEFADGEHAFEATTKVNGMAIGEGDFYCEPINFSAGGEKIYALAYFYSDSIRYGNEIVFEHKGITNGTDLIDGYFKIKINMQMPYMIQVYQAETEEYGKVTVTPIGVCFERDGSPFNGQFITVIKTKDGQIHIGAGVKRFGSRPYAFDVTTITGISVDGGKSFYTADGAKIGIDTEDDPFANVTTFTDENGNVVATAVASGWETQETLATYLTDENGNGIATSVPDGAYNQAEAEMKKDYAAYASELYGGNYTEDDVVILADYGTYDGRQAVVIWLKDLPVTSDIKTITVSDLTFTLTSGSLTISVHNGAEFPDIAEAYEAGLISYGDLNKIHYYNQLHMG